MEIVDSYKYLRRVASPVINRVLDQIDGNPSAFELLELIKSACEIDVNYIFNDDIQEGAFYDCVVVWKGKETKYRLKSISHLCNELFEIISNDID